MKSCELQWLQRDINKSKIIFEFEFEFELLEFEFEFELLEFEFEFEFVPRIFPLKPP